MTHLVDEALDVSRMTNGLLSLNRERVDLRVVILDAVETMQAEINGRDQCVTTRMPPAPVWVLGDDRRLEQVFINLIANASRYTHVRGKLTIWLYIDADDAVIRIRDSGIGIAADSLSGIFQLFRQANSADPRSKAGLGVGLALVRQLVELHGGTVTAASEGIGRGSEFTICLPILKNLLPVASAAAAEELGLATKLAVDPDRDAVKSAATARVCA
jgi:signal transduction histidine kinase